jgi:hypothetical protein
MPVGRPPYNRHPLAPAFALALAVVAGIVVALFAFDALGYAYRRIGIGQGELLTFI